ncbi:hypothetical protein V1525DRAFT_413800 [Lipomyces kononenkoae]|uniref:Uncharacterized protein n=1 Tax=Lipomyces kononenkoae TaxID=34357 RepID=A0ACC3SRG8_LIPKO
MANKFTQQEYILDRNWIDFDPYGDEQDLVLSDNIIVIAILQQSNYCSQNIQWSGGDCCDRLLSFCLKIQQLRFKLPNMYRN